MSDWERPSILQAENLNCVRPLAAPHEIKTLQGGVSQAQRWDRVWGEIIARGFLTPQRHPMGETGGSSLPAAFHKLQEHQCHVVGLNTAAESGGRDHTAQLATSTSLHVTWQQSRDPEAPPQGTAPCRAGPRGTALSNAP